MVNIGIKPPSDPVTAAATVGVMVGYVTGIVVMYRIAAKDLKRAHTLNREFVEDAWVYLPLDVKEKYNNAAEFYNISVQENL